MREPWGPQPTMDELLDEAIQAIKDRLSKVVIPDNIASLRASHERLLAAAKEALPFVVAKDCTPGRQIVTRLEAAIARAEDPAS